MKMNFNILICTLVTGLGLLHGATFSNAQEILRISENQIDEMEINLANPVQVSSTSSKNFPAQVVIPNDKMRVLTSMMSGVVNALVVAEGDTIKEGDMLAEISSPDFLEAQQNFLEALSRYTITSRNHSRNEELIKDGIISEKAFLAGQTELHEAESSLVRTRQTLSFSGMSDEQIEKLQASRDLKRTMIINAPFDGTVLRQFVETGEQVDEMTALYNLGQIDRLWLEIHVPLLLRSSLSLGDKINIAGTDIKGEIITIGQMVHEEDQGVLVRGLLDGSQKQLIPGQYVNVTFDQQMSSGIYYRIPTASVIRENNTSAIFVRISDGFTLKPVTIISEEGSTIVVAGDINSNDKIAITGIVTLKGILEGLGSDE